MPRARMKENGYDVVRSMRIQAKKGKTDNTVPIHDPDTHRFYCLWMVATNEYVQWDASGNPIYTQAFHKIFEACPQDLRFQNGYKIVKHKDVWKIYFLFTSRSDIDVFLSHTGLTLFRLTQKIPGVPGRWLPKDLHNIFRLESYPVFLSTKAIPEDDDCMEYLNKTLVPKAFGNRVFPISIIRIRRQRFSLEMEFSKDLSDNDVAALRAVEIEKHRLSVHGLFGHKHYSCKKARGHALRLLFV